LKRILSAVFFLISFAAAPVEAASVKLAWDPTENNAVVGYKIHYGVETGKYTKTLQVKGRRTTSAVVEGLEDGKTYFFAITSYDAKGKESKHSAEITNDPNRKPDHTGKSGDGTAPSPDQAGAHRKISHSRNIAKTPDGKILPSRSTR